MPKLNVEVVSAERVVFTGEADMVVAPGSMGVIGILPKHAPLLTSLNPGIVRIRREEGEEIMAVSGGFLQVNNDRVQILTDAAERAEEIDETRAEAARQRAQQILAENPKGRNAEVEEAEIALRKSLARLKVANLRRRRGQRQ
ncbi:MAG: F0F1 ATP synthase subunit epsilon [Chloroflexota bacterium]|jgi:F-type H+-transporting ATPase subunit epsilon